MICSCRLYLLWRSRRTCANAARLRRAVRIPYTGTPLSRDLVPKSFADPILDVINKYEYIDIFIYIEK